MACERCAFLIHRRNKISGENPAGDTLKRPGISRDIRDEIVKRIARNGVDEYLIPRNDALCRSEYPGPIRKRFHSYTFCGTSCHGKQIACAGILPPADDSTKKLSSGPGVTVIVPDAVAGTVPEVARITAVPVLCPVKTALFRSTAGTRSPARTPPVIL